MKNKINNRFLSLILAIFMVLSMVPMNAYSIDTTVGENEGLQDLLIYTGSTASNMQSTAILGKANDSYPNREQFNQEKIEYNLEQSDSIINTSLRFAVVPKEKNSTVKVVYADSTTDSAIKALTTTDAVTHTSSNFVPCMTKLGKNTFSIVVTPPEGSLNNEVVYKFTVFVKPTLSDLELYDGSNNLYLDKDFKSDITTYNALVSKDTNNITFNAIGKYDDYKITYDGGTSPIVNIEEKDKVEINVSIGEGSDKRSTEYTVNLDKAETYSAKINPVPNDSTVTLYDSHGVLLSKNIEGKYSDLLSGEKYTYVVTKYGYISKTGTLTGSTDLTEGVLNVTLEKAAEPSNPLPSYTGDWTSFRGNPENMGITNANTPTMIETAVQKWAVKYGTGWAAAPTPPLIINDALYIAVSDKVLKIDKTTGEKILESEALEGKVGYALNPITYGNGMVFVLIGEGRVQALRADTLESLWVSENLGSKAQTISPLMYHGGYVYTGVWNSGETEIGTYFSLSVTDEDIDNKTETKLNSWKLSHKGGFYWAGAYVTNNYLIVGSDDGSPANVYTDTAVVYSINPKNGEVIDTIDGIKGDIRSSVSFDKETNKAYFATKGGWFCTVKVNPDGTFDDSTFKYLDLGGMCTGTPLVYNNRAYIGSSLGNNQFGPGKLNVIDLSKESPELAYTAELPGYPQASAMLSSAYGETAYVYITYNNLPGGIYVIEDKVGQTSAKGYDLFIPNTAQQQYSISSLVADRDGIIYYKNDSCFLMAIENNTAYLKGLSADKGNLDKVFAANTMTYEIVVPIGTEEVNLISEPCEGGTISFNGSESSSVTLVDGKANVVIVVTKGTNTREYTISIREASNNAELSELNVNESNSYNSGNKALTPVFDNNTNTYGCFGISSSRSFVNLWPTAKVDRASVKVYAVSNIRASDVQVDGTINITGVHNNHNRYALYFADGSKPIVVRIVVTAEDGITEKDYKLIITKESVAAVSYASKIILDKSIVDISSEGMTKLSATLSDMIGTGAHEILYWSSSDENVAEVNQDGTVTAKKGGSAIITAKGALTSASCTVNVNTPELTLPDGDSPEITVPNDDENYRISIKEEDKDKNITINIPESKEAKVVVELPSGKELPEIETTKGDTSIVIPKGVQIINATNSSIELLTSKNNSDVVSIVESLLSDDTKLDVINKVFSMGGSEKVEFNDYITITLKDMAGKEAAYIQEGTIYVINKYENDSLGKSSNKDEYAYDSGKDLIIKTKHFTDFIVYSVSKIEDNNNGGGNPGTPVKSYITLSIDKKTINKGYVLSPTKVEITKGESVWNVLKRILDDKDIDYDYVFTPKAFITN